MIAATTTTSKPTNTIKPVPNPDISEGETTSESSFSEEESEESEYPVDDVFRYTPPRFPITKQEMFDEDNMKALLSDENFSKADRKHLSMYNKHRISGGRVNVCYKYAKGNEDLQIGRVYPEDGLGLQAFRFDMRNPLAAKYVWDTDIKNCHYVIALHMEKQMDLKCEKLQHYVTKRNECLKLVSANRKVAKTEFLKTLYLGNLHLYRDGTVKYDPMAASEISKEGHEFIAGLTKEVETLALKLWDSYPHLHKMKCILGGENKQICKQRNPKASLMSVVFQTEEFKILCVWDAFLTFKGRYMTTFIHDGGYVKKLEGETSFPPELLVQGAAAIKETLGYEVVLTQKDIVFDWVPPVASDDAYGRMKAEFEKHTWIVGNNIYHVQPDGASEFITPKQAEFRFAHMTAREWSEAQQAMVYVPFVAKWICDEKRKAFERMDFFPDESKCPDHVYNLFRGFRAEQFRPEQEMSSDEVETRVQPIIQHLDYLTKGHSAHMLKWLANIIQHPDRKSETAILLRDIGDLLCEGGGTGKNLFLEFFGFEILGEDYCLVVGDNKELYGSFNSQFEGKLLIFVEEASSKENHQNNDILKSKITSKKTNVNKKCVAQYTVNDYANYIFTSNNRNPLPIKQGNRRSWVFDTNPEKRGDTKYFEGLSAHLAKPATKWAFYQYLKSSVETYANPAQFSKAIPITEAYREIRALNAPMYLKWLVDRVTEGMLWDASTSDLYALFVNWLESRREKAGDCVISQTAFGTLLSSSTSVQASDSSYAMTEDTGVKSKRNGTMYMRWDVPAVVRGLKALHLLDDDFEYKAVERPAASCQV